MHPEAGAQGTHTNVSSYALGIHMHTCTCAYLHPPTHIQTHMCTHTSPRKVVGHNYCLPIPFLYLLVGFYRSVEILSFYILDLVLPQD